MSNDKWEERGKQFDQLVNSLCQASEMPFIDNKYVTNGMLNKSELHLNTVGTKVLVNNICKVMSQ